MIISTILPIFTSIVFWVIMFLVGAALVIWGIRAYRKREKEEAHFEAQVLDREMKEAKKQPPDIDDYVHDYDGSSTKYTSKYNSQIVIKSISVNNPNMLIFACSLPHNINNIASFKTIVPALIDVTIKDSHEISINKSPASSFYGVDGIIDIVLVHLFAHLNREYAWMKRKVKVILLFLGEGSLKCTFNNRAFPAERLIFLLMDIAGISKVWKADDAIMIMIDQAENWNIIMPKIKKILEGYFIGGVEYDGAIS